MRRARILAKRIRETNMARASKEQAGLNRNAVTTSAARLYRERGLSGVSVNELMADVGLTAGGFYSQFESKDELAALACEEAFALPNAKWRERLSSSPKPQTLLKNYLDNYLSAEERDCVGISCAAASLATDVGREDVDKPVHEAFVAGLEGMIENVRNLIKAAGHSPDKDDAIAAVAMLVGALTLARATRSDKLSLKILSAARRKMPKLFA